MFSYKYPHPAVSADCVVLTHDNGHLQTLLIRRKNPPYQGCWAFPGGFMNIDESAEDAARRELEEETGFRVTQVFQVGAFSKVDRDPRERVITIAFLAVVNRPEAVKAGDDAGWAQWFDLDNLPPLAFDHAEIMEAALKVYHRL